TRRVLQRSALGKCELDGALVSLARAHDALVRPDGNARRCRLRPLPLLEDVGVCLMNEGAYLREHLPAPVAKLLDLQVDLCGGRFHETLLVYFRIAVSLTILSALSHLRFRPNHVTRFGNGATLSGRT